ILVGTELIRKKLDHDAHGLTFSLLTTSEGKKMGKTQAGAVWLDPNKTSPYEFFQYWRNVEDADVIRCLKMLTFVSLEEIAEQYEGLEGSELNKAKERLAFELTKTVHGEEEAQKALDVSRSVFGGGAVHADMPTKTITAADFDGDAIGILDLLTKTAIAPSKSEARRLVQQGGILVNDKKVEAIEEVVAKDAFAEGYIVVKKGKKNFFKVELQ
ncbi:MAG: tyrosine--tRNA ligase, partial [Clostridia bacterium]|nr:tyrosine--tRNA ligase [Clostridia bacterium]